MSQASPANPNTRPPSDVSLFFRLAAVATTVFVITVMALIAAEFSDPQAPVAKFLKRSGGTIIVAEVAMMVVLSFVAMAVDRWRTLRRLGSQKPETAHQQDSDAPTT